MFSDRLMSDQDELLMFINSGHNINNYQQQQTLMQQNKLVEPSSSVPHCLENGNNIEDQTKTRPGRRRKASTAFDNTDESPADYLRKMIHRDVERQRRQEMAGLYQSLRPLIPSQFLQGKRSISDDVDGTIKYIRYMQKRTNDLKNKRDRLKELLNPSSSFKSLSNSKRYDQTSIVVEACREGNIIDVNVSTVLKGGLPLSRVLKFLAIEGMCIKNCISTTVHESVLHIIQIEVDEEKSVNPNELQGKLMGLIFNL